ncbi:MAG: MBL fold metallo-hydrolase [Muribaculaceae bacterium]|nr:MBL fold metallo-hydrolase [Muribaculaceae bacterium]
MKISKFTVNPFSENTFILWNEEGGSATVIDPGMSNKHECDMLMDFMNKNRLVVENVLLTHEHVDHIMGTGFLVEKYNCKVYGHTADIELGMKADVQLRMFNLSCEMKPFTVSDYVVDGDIIDFCGEKIEVLHTPGHSAGGVVYYLPESGCSFVGDTIFQMSIGRTDLTGGDYDTLISSIKNKLFSLPEDTVLYPGHGGATTVGEEQMYNPFVRG